MYTAKPYAVLSWAETLYQLLHGWQVDGGPGQPGPVVSGALAKVLAAQVIRDLARNIRDARLAESTHRMGVDLIRNGAEGLISGYDADGPHWPDYPWPLPWPPKKFEAQSVLDGVDPAALDAILAGVAQKLGHAVSHVPIRTHAAAG